jgi:hypothetical protein
MQYMLLIYGDPAAAEAAGDPPASAFQEWPEATRALAEDGVLLGGDGLQPVTEAASVRHRAGDELVTDGPFAETKEALLGYYLLDVPDRDTALGWAARMPMVHWGTVEVRAIMESPASAGAMLGDSQSAA